MRGGAGVPGPRNRLYPSGSRSGTYPLSKSRYPWTTGNRVGFGHQSRIGAQSRDRVIRATVDLLTDALLPHFSYEERELVEPLARHGFR